MNTSEPDHSQSGPTGLQVELGSRPKPYRLALWLVPLLVLAAGSVTLFAWLPASSPAPSLSPLATGEQSFTQPVITWSPNSIEVILSPGESASRSFTVVSSTDLTNVTIEAVATISPFLTIKPSTISKLRANKPQTVQLSFAIPPSATLGTYNGTIHLRVGSQTLPQTLKVNLNVWTTYRSPTFGYAVKYPPSLINISDPTTNAFGVAESAAEFETSGLWIYTFDNPTGLSALDWWLSSKFHTPGESVFNRTVAGFPAIEIGADTDSFPETHIVFVASGTIYDIVVLALDEATAEQVISTITVVGTP